MPSKDMGGLLRVCVCASRIGYCTESKDTLHTCVSRRALKFANIGRGMNAPIFMLFVHGGDKHRAWIDCTQTLEPRVYIDIDLQRRDTLDG